MKISELIKKLEVSIKEFGDLPIIVSSDSEGNSFGTLNKNSLCLIEDYNTGKIKGVCLYPFADGFYDADKACSFKDK